MRHAPPIMRRRRMIGGYGLGFWGGLMLTPNCPFLKIHPFLKNISFLKNHPPTIVQQSQLANVNQIQPSSNQQNITKSKKGPHPTRPREWFIPRLDGGNAG